MISNILIYVDDINHIDDYRKAGISAFLFDKMQKLGVPVAQVIQKCKRVLYFSYPALILKQDTTIK